MPSRQTADVALRTLLVATWRRTPTAKVVIPSDRDGQLFRPRSTQPMMDATVKVSMDSRGRWMDSVMIEQQWRSLTYEGAYRHAFETGSAARAGIGKWVTFDDTEHPHSSPGGRTPIEAHERAAA